MSNALKGLHVLVTRPAHQAENLCQLIEQQGGVAVRFPTLEIVGMESHSGNLPDNLALATKYLSELSNCQWLIFTSANAVNFALKANGGKIAELKAAQLAAIGQATAKALELVGLKVDLIPATGCDSEALLAMPQLQQVDGQDILIVRGQGGRDELANVLRSRGANVGYWEVYRRVMPDIDITEVIGLLEKVLLDVIIVTSFEALRNLLAMLGANYKKKLAMLPLVVISERIGKLAAELGFTQIAVTESPKDQAILDTVISLSGRGNTREQE
ncbi:uroporphyrinogen III synthase HEM4 [Methyloglobulus morosus KoM1]|uniref:Uroporphyrinogen-III synthase n=1 Tax=Methyloglobulus morosus KoM1 TaxID=1116472 RepID=V5C2E5_9GAMM|nr:uroporphyrinogen-III synthase [Methyloglobulus morosus]ESS72622.1 uroporphyrinogen III synthase HEM4 [Methyloglobulus morosus KoM1]